MVTKHMIKVSGGLWSWLKETDVDYQLHTGNIQKSCVCSTAASNIVLICTQFFRRQSLFFRQWDRLSSEFKCLDKLRWQRSAVRRLFIVYVSLNRRLWNPRLSLFIFCLCFITSPADWHALVLSTVDVILALFNCHSEADAYGWVRRRRLSRTAFLLFLSEPKPQSDASDETNPNSLTPQTNTAFCRNLKPITFFHVKWKNENRF